MGNIYNRSLFLSLFLCMFIPATMILYIICIYIVRHGHFNQCVDHQVNTWNPYIYLRIYTVVARGFNMYREFRTTYTAHMCTCSFYINFQVCVCVCVTEHRLTIHVWCTQHKLCMHIAHAYSLTMSNKRCYFFVAVVAFRGVAFAACASCLCA